MLRWTCAAPGPRILDLHELLRAHTHRAKQRVEANDGKEAHVINSTQVPAILRERSQWVCWRFKERDGKTTKVPINPRTVQNASSTDASTWATHVEALRAQEEHGLDGVGFVVTEDDDLVGVDLDNCISDDGSVADWALGIIRALNSYTEFSPSGHGLHVFVQGVWPTRQRNRHEVPGGGRVEVYGDGRYFTVTGKPYGAPRDVEMRQDALDAMGRVMGVAADATVNIDGDLVLDPSAVLTGAQMEEFLSGGRGARRRLALWDMKGRAETRPSSQSEADLMLANHAVALGWANQDIANLIIAHRRKHGKDVMKAVRPDYIRRTLAKARTSAAGSALDLLPFKVLHLVKVGKYDPEFLLELEGGAEIELGEAGALNSSSAFNCALLSAGFQLTRPARRAFSDIVSALLQIMVERPTSSAVDLFMEHIQRHLFANRPTPLDFPGGAGTLACAMEQDLKCGGVFGVWAYACMDGSVQVIHHEAAQTWVVDVGRHEPRATTAKYLRRLGFTKGKPVDITYKDPVGETVRCKRQIWLSRPGLLPAEDVKFLAQ